MLDNKITESRNVGILNGIKTFRDSVGRKDKNDFYTFTLTQRSSFALSLSQLKDNVDVALIQSGQTIFKSAKPKRKKEAIDAPLLEAGTYYVRVSAKSNSSQYRLKLTASTVFSTPDPFIPTPDSPIPPPVNPLPIIPAFTSRLLSTSALEIGSIDPTTGIFSLVSKSSASYNDIASAPNSDLFGVSSIALYKVDPTTGISSRIGSLGTSINMDSLAFASSGGLYAAGGSEFYSINTATGAATLIANIPGFESSGDLIYDVTSDRFLATSKNDSVDFANDRLYSIGLNGDAILIGDVGFPDVWGMAIANGILYGYTSNRRQIIINPTTGMGTFDRLVTGTTNQIYGAA
jgi:Bacterial pre-peptidase C-terminal domain